MCGYDRRDTRQFLMLALPFFTTTIGGGIVAGHGWYLLGWLAYALFFFLLWEARVLCSHCPHWAEEGRVLRCHANYGVLKLWRYHPEPMSWAERAQFALGATTLLLYPVIVLLIGGRTLLAAIAVASGLSAGYLLRRNVCIRCVNFSCPMNTVPKELVDAYLREDPLMRRAWEESGYHLGERRIR